MPYLIGGTITGSIMVYYHGFLITIIVNSIVWFVVSTLVNKYYWKYTGFKEEFQIVSKYIGRIKKRKSKSNFIIKDEKYSEGMNANNCSTSIDKGNKETDNLGSLLKF
jgi:hypothetical protein